MHTSRLFACTAAIVLVLSACAGPRDGGPSGPDGPMRGDMREPGRTAGGIGRLREDLQTQLSEVELKLALTPRQQVLWDRYRESVGALMADQFRHDPQPTLRLDAPRQIERKVDVVRNRLGAMEDIAEAAQSLYASLDADQQRLADRLLPGTVPALYSGLSDGTGGEPARRAPRERRGGGEGPL